MRGADSLRNNLRLVRGRLGLSQQELAARVGVARQTIGAVEAGLYTPSAALALRLARVLGCRVEEVFWLEEEPAEVVEAVPAAGLEAELGSGAGAPRGVPVSLVRVGGRWVAHSLLGESGVRTELVPADGEVLPEGRGAEQAEGGGTAALLQVRALDDPQDLGRSVMLAGCTPALSLWARAAERWHPGLRVHWVFANSGEALAALARGEVHGAGTHLYDSRTGACNVPFVRAALPGRAVALVNLGEWEEGLLVRRGNPRGIRGVADLARPGVTIVNREPGAGSRQLLEDMLGEAGLPPGAVAGFDRVVRGHLQVARAVAGGEADAGVSTEGVARAFGLDFVPLRRTRYEVAFLQESLGEPAIQQLLATLGHRRVRRQLEVVGGYDTARTGEVETVPA